MWNKRVKILIFINIIVKKKVKKNHISNFQYKLNEISCLEILYTLYLIL